MRSRGLVRLRSPRPYQLAGCVVVAELDAGPKRPSRTSPVVPLFSNLQQLRLRTVCLTFSRFRVFRTNFPEMLSFCAGLLGILDLSKSNFERSTPSTWNPLTRPLAHRISMSLSMMRKQFFCWHQFRKMIGEVCLLRSSARYRTERSPKSRSCCLEPADSSVICRAWKKRLAPIWNASEAGWHSRRSTLV